jgi:hypothetical protein
MQTATYTNLLRVVVDQQVELVEVAVDEALARQAADELHARQVHLAMTRCEGRDEHRNAVKPCHTCLMSFMNVTSLT